MPRQSGSLVRQINGHEQRTCSRETFAAAPAKERISTILAKIARPSKSGSWAIWKVSNLETMSFDSFYF
jgi:hypothetical protein